MSFEDDTVAFERWLDNRGVQLSPKVKIDDYRPTGQGRGMTAIQDIEKGELLFSIPQKALLAPVNFPSLDLQEFMNEQIEALDEEVESSGWDLLIAYMLLAVNSDEWKPYFNVLPAQFDTPIFWTEKQLELLKGSTVVNEIGKEEAEEMYERLAKTVLKHSAFENVDTSIESFHRMASLIMAYAFDVNISGEPEDAFTAMVPLADTLNSHTTLANARLEMPETEDGNLEMRASHDIAQGTQVYNFYGDLPNRTLLRKYGYVEQGGTAHEDVELPLTDLLAAFSQITGKSEEDLQTQYDEFLDELDEQEADFDYFNLTFTKNYEPSDELIISANALVSKNIQEVLDISEKSELYSDAQKGLLETVDQRLKQYNEQPALGEAHGHAYTRIEDMATQLIRSEIDLLKHGREWVAGASIVRETKKSRS